MLMSVTPTQVVLGMCECIWGGGGRGDGGLELEVLLVKVQSCPGGKRSLPVNLQLYSYCFTHTGLLYRVTVSRYGRPHIRSPTSLPLKGLRLWQTDLVKDPAVRPAFLFLFNLRSPVRAAGGASLTARSSYVFFYAAVINAHVKAAASPASKQGRPSGHASSRQSH